MARRLTAIPGVGPIIAATVRAAVPDPSGFRSGRDFAAWIGLMPRSSSSGGKEKLRSISKRGNPQLRSLLVVGAMAILKLSRNGVGMPPWVNALLQRRPFKVRTSVLDSGCRSVPGYYGFERRRALEGRPVPPARTFVLRSTKTSSNYNT